MGNGVEMHYLRKHDRAFACGRRARLHRPHTPKHTEVTCKDCIIELKREFGSHTWNKMMGSTSNVQ